MQKTKAKTTGKEAAGTEAGGRQQTERKAPKSDELLAQAEKALTVKTDTKEERKRRILERCGCL